MVTTLKENFYQGSTVGQETSPKLEEIGINKINNQRDEEPKSQMDIMIENFQKKTQKLIITLWLSIEDGSFYTNLANQIAGLIKKKLL